MQRLTGVVKVVPGFNGEVKFYKRVTREGGAIETEPTTLAEINMQMEITTVLPPQPQSRRESELSRKLEAAYAEAAAAKRQRTGWQRLGPTSSLGRHPSSPFSREHPRA